MDIQGSHCGKILQKIANDRAAWHSILEDMGIDPGTMEKFAPPSHIAAEIFYDFLPEPDEKAVIEIARRMRNFSSQGPTQRKWKRQLLSFYKYILVCTRTY